MVTEKEAFAEMMRKDAEKISERAAASGVSAIEFVRAYNKLHQRQAPNEPIPQYFSEREWADVILECKRGSTQGNIESAASDAAHQKRLTQSLEPKSGQTKAVRDGDRYPGLEQGTSPQPGVDRSSVSGLIQGREGTMYFTFESEVDFVKWQSMNSNLKIQSKFWDERTHRLVVKVAIDNFSNLVVNNSKPLPVAHDIT
jgi:hypothetical protein